MAGRSKSTNLLLRSISLPRSSKPCIFTRSLLTERTLPKTPIDIRIKSLSNNFFIGRHPQPSTSKIAQLCQKRTYNTSKNSHQKDSPDQISSYEIKNFAGDVILGLLIISSITVFALREHSITLPESIVSWYPKLQNIETFIRENFTLSQHNLEMGRWWTYITHTLNHSSVLHLGVNMAVLWSVGRSTVHFFGPLGMSLIYVVGGVAGGILGQEWEKKKSHIPRDMVGASGSVSGLVAAMSIVLPMSEIGIMFIPWVSIPAWLFSITFAGFSVYAETHGILPGIAHMGHVGGMGGGAVIALVFRIMRRRF